jgi:hypothetical protein
VIERRISSHPGALAVGFGRQCAGAVLLELVGGYRDQLIAVSARTGWEPRKLEVRLKATVPGSQHDQLDAFMAAWVASLAPRKRRAFGNARRPDDAIWVPL